MARVLHFDSADLVTVQETAQQSEDLSCRHFGLENPFMENVSYEYRTLADLKNTEIIDHGFAQLVRYRLRPHKTPHRLHSRGCLPVLPRHRDGRARPGGRGAAGRNKPTCRA